jgi:hypothetical protein
MADNHEKIPLGMCERILQPVVIEDQVRSWKEI